VSSDGSLTLLGRPHDFRNTIRHIHMKDSVPAIQRATHALARTLFPADAAPIPFAPPRADDPYVFVVCSPSALTAALTASGRVYALGGNTSGQAGVGRLSEMVLQPERVRGLAADDPGDEEAEAGAGAAAGGPSAGVAAEGSGAGSIGGAAASMKKKGAATAKPNDFSSLLRSHPLVRLFSRGKGEGESGAADGAADGEADGEADGAADADAAAAEPRALPTQRLRDPILGLSLGFEHGLALTAAGHV
jgi:hypothetical protein